MLSHHEHRVGTEAETPYLLYQPTTPSIAIHHRREPTTDLLLDLRTTPLAIILTTFKTTFGHPLSLPKSSPSFDRTQIGTLSEVDEIDRNIISLEMTLLVTRRLADQALDTLPHATTQSA